MLSWGFCTRSQIISEQWCVITVYNIGLFKIHVTVNKIHYIIITLWNMSRLYCRSCSSYTFSCSGSGLRCHLYKYHGVTHCLVCPARSHFPIGFTASYINHVFGKLQHKNQSLQRAEGVLCNINHAVVQGQTDYNRSSLMLPHEIRYLWFYALHKVFLWRNKNIIQILPRIFVLWSSWEFCI